MIYHFHIHMDEITSNHVPLDLQLSFRSEQLMTVIQARKYGDNTIIAEAIIAVGSLCEGVATSNRDFLSIYRLNLREGRHIFSKRYLVLQKS